MCLLERVSSELRVELKGEMTVEEKDILGRGNYLCKRLSVRMNLKGSKNRQEVRVARAPDLRVVGRNY